uniref:Uncharacterized protein n=1 Tax=Anguilla anguilla TaxID=7936 RepID=A0A0E9UGK0_ANGAN
MQTHLPLILASSRSSKQALNSAVTRRTGGDPV